MVAFFPPLQEYVERVANSSIPSDRQALLTELVTFIQEQAGRDVKLTFVCTHNSRRSHLTQVWAQTLATYYQIPQVETFSGGTEATACNPRTVRALRDAGFQVDRLDDSENPHYRLQYAADHTGMELWSKVYTDPANPRQGFGAIMTCDSANEACPVVIGAAARFPILYEDPKAFDDTPQEAQAYADRCWQIATEMNWVMKSVVRNQT